MEVEPPRTPSKVDSIDSESDSKIPSPNGPGSPKYRKRSASPKPSVSASEHRNMVNHTKKHNASSEGSSHMTAFYRENIRQLNELQDIMFQKKCKLDAIKDELGESKDEFRTLMLKLETLKEEKNVKLQQIKLKNNDLKKLSDEHVTREKFVKKGHDIEMQQLRVKSAAELNALESEYRCKIEDMRFEKIKKLELARDALRQEIGAVKARISGNDETRKQSLNECQNRYNYRKEEWLRTHQKDLSALIEDSVALNRKSDALQKTLDKDLKIRLAAKSEELKDLKTRLKELEERLGSLRSLNSQIEEQTSTFASHTIEALAKRDELDRYISSSNSELEQIGEILMKEETMRRKLHNELQELRGNIRVFCRLRPHLDNEKEDSSSISIDGFSDENGTQCITIKREAKYHKFTFDRCFGAQESNKDIFHEIGQLIQSSLDGYNVCIFAYGQTGSGKTYTMLNPEDGIIPSTLNHIFLWVEKLKELGWSYDISSQFIEIYNENIKDLFKDHDTENDDGSEASFKT